MMINREWDSEIYNKYIRIASKLTDKGLRICLNQREELLPEVIEAFEDILREREAGRK